MTLDFKQRHFYIQIWKSRFSNLKILIFKFEYPDFQIWISRSQDWPLRHWDIQIWISRFSNLNIPKPRLVIETLRYSNLNIPIFKFEYLDIYINVIPSYYHQKRGDFRKKIRYYLGTFPKCWTPPFFSRNHWDELIELIRYYLPLYGKHVLASQNDH